MEDLEKIVAPVAPEFSLFEQQLRLALHSEVELVNKIVTYLLTQESKRLRPLLVLLSARLCGIPNAATINAAGLVEILHTATLVHDDVVDESLKRRGMPSVNAVWNNKIAVLLGDFLFSKSLQMMLQLRDFDALGLLAITSELLSAGEILQLEKANNNTMNEETYYQMIWAKTASLFATSCKIGAMTVGATPETCEALYDYGSHLGMAFQIKDDLFDLVGSEYRLGKPIGRDLKSNLITLPLIFTLKQLDAEAAAHLRQTLKQDLSDTEISQIRQLIHDTGGISYAQERMQFHSARALESLKQFPESDVKSSLQILVQYNESRSR